MTGPASTSTTTRERMRRAPVETGLGMAPDPASTREDIRLRLPLHDGVRDAGGRVLPLLPALLADSGIGYLVFSTGKLTAGAPTVELRLDLAATPAPHAAWLTAGLTLLHLDDEIGVGRAEIRDDTGVLVAHAVVSMAVTGVPDRPGGLARAGGPIDPSAGGSRDGAAGTGLGTSNGLGAATATATATATDTDTDTDFRSALPPFDPQRLRPDRLEFDGADAVFTPGPSTVNLNGTTHGAVLSGFAAAAQAAHLGEPAARPLSLTVEFLRPVHVDVALRARTTTVRDGRRFWAMRTELLLPDGRAAVRATGSGLRPGS